VEASEAAVTEAEVELAEVELVEVEIAIVADLVAVTEAAVDQAGQEAEEAAAVAAEEVAVAVVEEEDDPSLIKISMNHSVSSSSSGTSTEIGLARELKANSDFWLFIMCSCISCSRLEVPLLIGALMDELLSESIVEVSDLNGESDETRRVVCF